ncbi:NYN domain-containing protein [Glaciecola sp. XM2]|uniref:NYN domain-containing protein n=1 Tax=Glaciecola sp. XM2 TaxID=1914931 RepID=UPI001BDDECFA|nr:NYN domain-containing protein [Glaciecola sp. XM2]MBT1451619.1 NYN domain-containing protein [Glaciecola sp. XM2]
MNKVAVFVDVQNIYYTTRQALGGQFNYRQFWRVLSQTSEIVVANAYAIDKADEQQRKFQSALRHIGFDVKLKPFIQRSDGTAKGDWDVGITIDVMTIAPEVDEVILLSGDGDFAILLDTISERYGVKTTAYGVPALTAQALMNAANSFVTIDQHWLL